MMRYVYWGLTILFAIVVACFAVSNRTLIDLEFWPLPLALSVPVYLIVLAVLLLGLLAGWLAGWVGSWGVRRERRRQAKRIAELERALGRLQPVETPVPAQSLVSIG
jgi:uncharacterized integral membrane protein